MHFYEQALGAKLEMTMTEDEAQGAKPLPKGKKPRILHARLNLKGGILMASDWMVDDPYPGMRGFRVCLTCATKAEAERAYAALSKGGQVNMPLAETFWNEAFAMLADRFGTPWMISGPSKQPG
jgi:PhnB protein